MAFPVDPDRVPAHRLFPEHYEASKRIMIRDFAFFGSITVLSIVLGALATLALS